MSQRAPIAFGSEHDARQHVANAHGYLLAADRFHRDTFWSVPVERAAEIGRRWLPVDADPTPPAGTVRPLVEPTPFDWARSGCELIAN